MSWLVWLLAVVFYFYDIILRVFPSVLITHLMQDFSLSAEHLGFVNSLYFWSYALMQLPVGILLDRFGVAKTLSISALLAGLGGILFGLAKVVWVLALARIMMGVGTSFAFVGMLYIVSHLFPASKTALLIGLGSAIGFAGAISGEGPISLLENVMSWRSISFFMGGCGIVLALFIFFVMHNLHNDDHLTITFKEALRGFVSILSCKTTWLLGMGAFLLYATTSCMAAFWGVDFLEHTQKMGRSLAGFANSMIYVGWIVGGPLIGLLSDRIKLRRPLILGSAILGFASLAIVAYFSLSHAIVFAALFFVGFFSGAQLLYYSFAIDHHEGETVGSVTAFINFATTMGGALFLSLFGFILDQFWTGASMSGVRQYSLFAFRVAISILPLAWILAIPFTLPLKEKT